MRYTREVIPYGIIQSRPKERTVTWPDNDRPQQPAELSAPLQQAERSSTATSDENRPPNGYVALPPPPANLAGDPQATFPPGTLLAGRFCLVKCLGHGAMGEVYEAEDMELSEHIALKTLLPQIAKEEHYLERFRREVLLARKVTHPNVCRIFDVFRHPADTKQATGSSAGIAFLTMELLEGETLSHYLRAPGEPNNKKRLTTEESLPLVQQMAEALEAAHRAGVVHRDFKTSNIMLVTAASAELNMRVVVTDFGLAHSALSAGFGGASLTGSGDLVGTPLYMAPEQVDGGPITAETDIYALGIVLYEMVTGQWPFMEETAMATARKRLREKPAPPQFLVPDLSRRWNDVIMRCLEREPADRFHNAREVAAALTGEAKPLRHWTRAQKHKWRVLVTLTVLAGIIGTIGYGGYRLYLERKPGVVVTGGMKSVAVLRLENLTHREEDNWIATSLEDTLPRELSVAEGIRPIPREDVTRARSELDLPAGEMLDPISLERIRSDLGSDIVVLGGYETTGNAGKGQIKVSLNIQDASGRTIFQPVTATGEIDHLFELGTLLGKQLRKSLGVAEVSDAAQLVTLAALPATTAANRAYSLGLEKLAVYDLLGAKDHFDDAIRDAPEAPQPHAALADALSELGFDAQAAVEARHAFELSGKLGRTDQLAMQCRALELARTDWESAIQACRSVWSFRPDLKNGLRLASVQLAAGGGQEAIITLDAMRSSLPKPDHDDARIDLAESVAREVMTQYPAQLAAADRAIRKAEGRGMKLLEARGLLYSCVAQQSVDNLKDAQKTCQAANDLFLAVGDRIGQARAITNQANVLDKQEKTEEATKKYKDALKLATEVGSVQDSCDALMNMGTAFLNKGDQGNAKKKYEEALKLAEKAGNLKAWGRATGNLGLMLRNSGQFASAQTNFEQARNSFQKLQLPVELAKVNSNFGEMRLWEGDPRGAEELLNQALKEQRSLNVKEDTAHTLGALGDVAFAQDKLSESQSYYEESIKMLTELKDENGGKVLEISLANTLLEINKGPEATAQARALVDYFHKAADPDNEAAVRDVYARALLATGDKTNALLQAQLSAKSGKTSSDPQNRLTIAVGTARVFLETGLSGEANEAILLAKTEAKRRGLPGIEMEARLEEADLDIQKARTLAAKTKLKSLAADAQSRGFARLLRKSQERLSTLGVKSSG